MHDGFAALNPSYALSTPELSALLKDFDEIYKIRSQIVHREKRD
jgi:hypothetical protein